MIKREIFVLMIFIVLYSAQYVNSENIDTNALTSTSVTMCDPSNSNLIINSPGTYTLINNVLINASSSCFNINASNVVLDCQGFEIRGKGSGTGVRVLVPSISQPRSNIVVRNCIINNFSFGISFSGIFNSPITNSVIDNNLIMNIQHFYPSLPISIGLSLVNNLNVTRNRITKFIGDTTFHSGSAIEVCYADRLIMDSNVISDSMDGGFEFGQMNNSIINNNTVMNTEGPFGGILFYDRGSPLFCGSDMFNITVSNNNAINNSRGFDSVGSVKKNFLVINNNAIGNNLTGTGFNLLSIPLTSDKYISTACLKSSFLLKISFIFFRSSEIVSEFLSI